jgi:hypothetical protein
MAVSPRPTYQLDVDKQIAKTILEAPCPMSPTDAAHGLALEHAEDLVHGLLNGAELEDLLARIDRIRRLVERMR